MRWPARLWFVGSWWLAPAMTVLGFYYVTSLYPDTYTQPIAGAVSATEASGLTFALAGAAAALVGARLRSAGFLLSPSPRPQFQVLAEAVLPVFVTASLVTAATIIWGQVREQALGWPGFGVLGVYAAILWAVLCWGLALGTWFRGWIAAPAILVATFLVLGFPPAMYPLWLRHMFGISSCCNIDQTVDTRVVWASICVALGSALAALLVARSSPAVTMRPRRLPGALMVAAAVQVTALLGGAILVSDMASEPTIARPGQPECRPASGVISLCVWPEHEQARAEYAPVLAAVERVERRVGLAPTKVFTEKGIRDSVSTASMVARPGLALELRVDAMISSLASGGSCLDSQGNQLTPGPATWEIPAQATLERWWFTQLSAELSRPIEMDPNASPDDLLKGLDPARQKAWINAITAARRTCQPSFPPTGVQ